MATRVFLLSADEKAVHVITQILDEQDIRFEHSSDPTFTLKRLAGQHFEVLIVDCDNAESAMQVFNSARASSLNKAAIAIAIVEGKAGVPNAFRLGASLVLTKPVSMDQARNTLRTAVGMTRKDTLETRPAVAPPATIVATPAHVAPVPVASTPMVVGPVGSGAPSTAQPASPPQVINSKPFEVAAAIKIPAPPIPAASARTETIVVEKPTSIPAAVKAQPVLQLAETRVFKSEEIHEVPPATEKDPNSNSEKTALSLSSAMLGSTTSASTLDKLETAVTSLKSEAKAANTLEMFAPLPKELVEPANDQVDVEPEETAASLRANAVPAFGGLAKQPFAGIEPERRGRVWLISGLVAAIAGGAFAAAWFYAPGFQKTVTWEYVRIREQVQNVRAKSTSPAALNRPAPSVQVAAPSVPAPSVPAPIDQPANSAAVEPQTSSTPAPLAAAANPASQPVAPAAASSARPAAPTSAAPVKNKPTPTPAPGTPSGTASLVNTSAASVPVSAAPKPAELFEVPEDYADDQVIHRVHPVYPNSARARKLQGTVVLQAIIDKQGKVDSLQLVSGDPLLAQAAASAVKQWRYKPYSHNGDPAEFQTRVTVDFKLP
jgi:protein TonB